VEKLKLKKLILVVILLEALMINPTRPIESITREWSNAFSIGKTTKMDVEK
jgi:hypothetical protein